ncbi:ABC transporter permease [Dactylosporangium matsuzakiense]|uniref:Transport permease protein n=1 Tax=Dactylosporangium matsuzakiense TaxID=53360 RepID=A0A9W6KSU6_9ACTN|nr:ABC transporter permease [Dactylosporangium matsuzakiense]UWZ46473.1 ABC transporter permease [Dactylosporangium matsuzakiense]GLL06603.1 transport permease protein [Dactylosporangium matsuzakiense]
MRDALTMLRRDLRHNRRNPSTMFGALIAPILMLLMFVYIFGGATTLGTSAYLAYVVPGILVLCIGYSVGQTAVAVATDMNEGIINRFRTMGISRAAVLTGRVLGTVLRTLLCVLLILLLTLAMGYRPHATLTGWLTVTGVVALSAFAAAWLTTAMGLSVRTVVAASYAALPITLLPILSSAFAPTQHMSAGVRAFTEHQPYTPIIESLREALNGAPAGSHLWWALGWTAAMAIAGYLWSRARFTRPPTPR